MNDQLHHQPNPNFARAPLSESFPSVFQSADKAAVKVQAELFRLTAMLLMLAVIAAAFGSISLKADHEEWAALGSLVVLTGSIVVAEMLRRRNLNRCWYRLRALTESVKSLTWLYCVGGGDFANGTLTDVQARREFADRLTALRLEYVDTPLQLGAGNPEAVTEAMTNLRCSSLDQRRAIYRAQRLDDQLSWYGHRADQHARRRDIWNRVGLGLQALAFVAATLRFFEVIGVDLVGIATTAVAGTLAWQRSQDNEGIAEAYARTAYELAEVMATLEDANTEGIWADFVASAESAMSREHTSWWARRRGSQH